MNLQILERPVRHSAHRPGTAETNRPEDLRLAFAMRAIDFVSTCNARNPVDLVERFLSLVAPLGIEQVAMLDLWRAELDIAASIRFTTFDPQLVRSYIRERRDRSDPIWHSAMLESRSRRWSQTWANPRANDLQMIEFYRDCGLHDGLTVPILNARGQRSTIFLGASRPLTLAPSDEAALTVAAGVFGAFATEIMPSAPSGGCLTAREREVLTLTALGKSARQIGVALGVSETTIARHLLNIRVKLQCANTVQAVACAIKEQVIVI